MPSSLTRVFLCLITLTVPARAAQFELSPPRVVLTDAKRVGVLLLRNLGATPVTYQLSLGFSRMSPDGSLTPVGDPRSDERSALLALRLPHEKIVVEGGEEQSVTVVATLTKWPPGEYRAEVRCTALGETPARATATAETSSPGPTVSVPVLYRRGKARGSAQLSNLRLVDRSNGAKGYAVDLASVGHEFVYGDLEAFFTPRGGTAEPVGLIRGVTSYLPVRTVEMPLILPPGVSLAHGTLRVDLRPPLEPESKVSRTLARAELVID